MKSLTRSPRDVEREQLIAFRRRVNRGLLERLWDRVNEARATPEHNGEGLEDLQEPSAPDDSEDPQ